MVTIRKVKEEDNAALAKAIRQVLIDIGALKWEPLMQIQN